MKGRVVIEDDYFDMFLEYLKEPKHAVSAVEMTKFYIDNFRDVYLMKEKVGRSNFSKRLVILDIADYF